MKRRPLSRGAGRGLRRGRLIVFGSAAKQILYPAAAFLRGLRGAGGRRLCGRARLLWARSLGDSRLLLPWLRTSGRLK